ncbi:MAG: precorrin-4 C(11)-methyltransferase [Actinomycetota bacterium]|nr:precorrin-4 C(11)-methyltransferase [Actinomycetota bacterium]
MSSAVATHPVLFVGAGPGDPELITVRGMRALGEADLVIYAGSLVPEAVLSWVREGARVEDSASLTLEEQVALMVEGHRAGQRVVRLHTGDPALFGATAEQWRGLQAADVPFEVVPGVSSLFASAAALPAELTMPGVSQCVIVCRAAGRTPVPDGQGIASLAAHRATMAIFLSAGLGASVAADLGAHYPAGTPAAIVQRASWPEQRVVRCTVATLAESLAEEGIDRTAMILVGEALGGAGEERSLLYHPAFSHGYRDASTEKEN